MVADNLQGPNSRSRARVFLSYCHADPNADVVRAVQTAIADQHDVFCDVVSLEPGVPWGTEIEAKLAEADYFVVFLSAEAAKSKALAEETRRAVKLQDEIGRPRILPVPLAYDIGDLGFELGALLKPFQGIFFWQTPEDTGDLIDDLENVFTGAWVAPEAEIAPALSRYLISPTRKARIREVFVPPADVKKARDSIRSGQVLWITGAIGAGKHFLASALACELDKPAFELRRTLSWRHIFQHRPTKSVLVLPDALVLERAGAGDYEAELSALRQICETDNTILLTCSDEEYTTRNSDLIDAGFTPARLSRYQLTEDMYSLSLRNTIIRNLVTQSHAAGIVTLAQRQWIDKLQHAQPLPWKDWTLGELESFVTRSLPTTKSQTDIIQLLDRHATIEDQIHVWFLGLDEAAWSLLLTLILFPETTSEEVWVRFRAILLELETLRLVPQMSVPTLGVCRSRCKPYVTQTDDLDIVESDVASAIAREFAISWREYVIELRSLMTRWAVPPAGQDRALTRSAVEESAAVRQRVARLLGELLKVRVEDVLPFLEDFATFEQSAVRRAAAEAVVYAFGSEDGAHNCRKLLRAWEVDRSDAKAAVRKREVAADASWRIAALSKDSTNYKFALEQLQRLARDVPRVRAMVAYGVGRIVNRHHTDELMPLIARLARDHDEIVRRRTGVALNELARREPRTAEAVFADWLASSDTRRLWTAAYALLVAPRPGRGDRDKLHALMHLDPAAFAGALASSLTPGDEAKDTDKTEYATRNLLRLAANTDSADQVATALGAHWSSHPERGALLCERLVRLAEKSVNDVLVDAYEQRLLKATSVSQFQETALADVGAGGSRQQIAVLAVTRIISKWTGELELSRIAEAWEEAPDLFERFLHWLRTDLGDAGRDAVVDLRFLILGSLVVNSKELVMCAASWLWTPTTSDEAKDAIRTIMEMPELRTILVTPLSVEYWGPRSDNRLLSVLGDPGRGAFVLLRRLILETLF